MQGWKEKLLNQAGMENSYQGSHTSYPSLCHVDSEISKEVFRWYVL